MTLTEEIKAFGLNLGYARIGITSADDFVEYGEELRSRGDMYDFFVRNEKDMLLRTSPRFTVPSAKSIVVLVWDYAQKAFPRELVGKVGRVYQNRCYNPPDGSEHEERFGSMAQYLRDKGMQVSVNKALPDRWAAARAGVATFGKNNFVYAEGIGSFINIRTIVVDAELDWDTPTVTSKCPANCTRCVDACPSKALYEPYRLDPKRCLAFNAFKTVKETGCGVTDSMPRGLRSCMGEQVHGCDLCQEACPRNRAKLTAKLPDDELLVRIAADFDLVKLLHIDEEFYQSCVKPIMYNYLREPRYFQRNAAVALGNGGDPSHLPELEKELAHPDETVREHVAWAIGAIGGPEAEAMLRRHEKTEISALVLDEIRLALNSSAGSSASGTRTDSVTGCVS